MTLFEHAALQHQERLKAQAASGVRKVATKARKELREAIHRALAGVNR